jgi:hypothetical protein
MTIGLRLPAKKQAAAGGFSPMKKVRGVGALAAGICVLAGCFSGGGSKPAATAPGQGQYGSYTQSYTVPWVHAPNFANLTATLEIEASVNGGTLHTYTVDTGSVGTVAPANEVPNLPHDAPTVSLTYSSSGLTLTGKWATLPVSFPQAVNASGAIVAAQAMVPVLAVESAKCTGSGVNSHSCNERTKPHMLGVGFGRGTTAQSAPSANAFLNLTEMAAGTMRRGYIIGRAGLSLGLTGSDVTGNWSMQTLTNAGPPAAGTHNDWQTPTGSFQIGSGAPYPGTALIDTGIRDMIIEDPSLPTTGTVAAGTPMTITLGSRSYSFTVGDDGPQTPTKVNHAPPHGTFMNTGLRALGRYDLLFDADGGYLGLRAA